MRKWPCSILIACCLLASLRQQAEGQQFRTYLYGELEGLPSSWVTDIDQGPDGRMWFATRSGLVIHDGSHWEVLDRQRGLPSNGCLLVGVASNRVVAAASHFRDGLTVLRGDAIEQVPPPEGVGGEEQPVDLCVDEDGFYLAASRSLWRWSGSYWSRISLGTDGGRITSMVSWRDGVLVVCEGRIFSVDRAQVRQIPCERKIHGVGIHCNGQSLWVIGHDWIGRLEGGRLRDVRGESHKIRHSVRQRVCVVDDGFGGVFAGNDIKLIHFDAATGVVRSFDDTAGHPAGGATALFRDRDQNTWISSLRGLTRVPSLRFANYSRAHGLQGQEVSALAELSSGQIVLGHSDGLTLMEDNIVVRRNRFMPAGQEPHGDIKTLEFVIDDSDLVWIAAAQMGLGRMPPDKDIEWFTAPDGQPVYGIAPHGDSGLWVVTSSNLYRFEDDQFTGPIEAVAEERAYRRAQRGHDGALHLHTMGQGLIIGSSGSWRRIRTEVELRANSTFSSLWDPLGKRLMVGTRAGLFEVKGDQLVRSTAPKIESSVYSLILDDSGKLWCGTHEGLVTWDGEKSRLYTVHQGLSGQETNRGAALNDQKGRLWIGTDRGVSCYRSIYDDMTSLPPLVAFTGIVTGDHQIDRTRDQTLDFGSGDLVFSIRALSFVDNGAARFRCRLAGYEQDWWEPDALSKAALRFTNLPRGSYRLEVAAMNSRGVWSDTISSPRITVKGALWESLLFKGIVGVVIAALGFGISRYVHQRRHSGELQELVEKRTADLEAATRRYRDLFEKNRAAQLFVDARNGEIQDANPAACALFHLGADQLKGQHLANLCDAPESWVLDTLRKALEGESLQRLTPLHVQGKRRDAEIHACLYDPKQKLIQTTIHDVTEHHQLEVELHQARRLEAIGRLAGGVAHDFNNLLAAIIGHAEGKGSDEPEDRDAILGLAKRGASLVQQLLAFGRRQEIRPETLEVNDLISKTLSVLKRVLPETVLLKSRLDPQAGHIHCDWAQMELVLLNLAVNARDAMPEGGTLEIRTRQTQDPGPDPKVCIEVMDSGEGMSASTLESVFEPFFTTKSAGQGTGLGLSTVYGIVQQSGGTVVVKSSLGEGTTVTIQLPVVQPSNPKPTKPPQEIPSTEGTTILVVEDDPAVRPMIARMLRRRGFEVVEAADGAEALEICRAGEIPLQVVLSDITMPNLDGPELALHLRTDRPDLKVLFMSGYRGGMKKGLEWTAFIPKPFSSDELARRIHELLDPTGSPTPR